MALLLVFLTLSGISSYLLGVVGMGPRSPTEVCFSTEDPLWQAVGGGPENGLPARLRAGAGCLPGEAGIRLEAPGHMGPS